MVQRSNFDVGFNMTSLVQMYGSGEYTVMVGLSNNTANANSTFVGATYTFFIGGNGLPFTPTNV